MNTSMQTIKQNPGDYGNTGNDVSTAQKKRAPKRGPFQAWAKPETKAAYSAGAGSCVRA